MMATFTLTSSSRYTLLCIASSGTWYLVAAIYELIFDLHEPQQSEGKACKDTNSKVWSSAMWSFKLKGND